jgi:hypothetical protein
MRQYYEAACTAAADTWVHDTNRECGLNLHSKQWRLQRVPTATLVQADALVTPAAGLLPDFEQLELLASHMPPGTPLEKLFDKFASNALMDGQFFFCNQARASAHACTACEQARLVRT